MSEPPKSEQNAAEPRTSVKRATSAPRRPRLRLFVSIGVALTVLAISAACFLVYWTSTASFENWARKRIAANLSQATGARVEIEAFHWKPLELDAELDHVAFHGLEAAGEAPLAHAARVHTRLSILDFWSPRILLRDLEIVSPNIHLIVYPDGSTNQPRPSRQGPPGRSMLDTLFDLRAAQVAVEQGMLHFDDRAASFDFQNRYIPLDLAASDVSVQMRYASAAQGKPETYHVEAGARDLALTRGAQPASPPLQGYLQASLDLTRTAFYVNSLRITSRDPASKDIRKERTLQISASLEDFARPHWQGRAAGDLDMRMVEPVTGYPFVPEGLARLDLSGAGQGGQFRIDGAVHVEDGAYVGTGVNARNFNLDAHLHADPEQLLITSIGVRFKQGERMDGSVALDHWLPPVPGAATIGRAGQSSVRAAGPLPPQPLAHPAPIEIPVNGKVNASFKDLSLDMLLDMVGQPPLQRLGFDTRLNGPATATWVHGDTATLTVVAQLALNAPDQVAPGEVPAGGVVDATYNQRTGAVDLRRLELNTPGGQLAAHGELGSYPVSSATSLVVDFHSHNLHDYDTFLRNLGLRRNGKSGSAALPVDLEGQVDFQGTWSGSLIDPHLAGTAQAAQLAIEMAPGDKTGQPQWVHWDTVEATGSYSSARIAVDHGFLRRGDTQLTLDGSLASTSPPPSPGHPATPSFDMSSILRLHLRAAHVGVDQLTPIVGRELPVAGVFDAQLELNGPIRTASGSGWVQMDSGSAYGQTFDHFRAQGTIADRTVKLSSVTASAAGGAIHASGQVDLDSRKFQLDSRGSGIDLAALESLRNHGADLTGKLGFTVTGSGTFDDPQLEAHARADSVAWNGQPLGPLEITARTANHSVSYEAGTHFEAASISLRGQTALAAGYDTRARMGFTQFNVAALFRMARLEGLTGESALEGTVSLDGPLARPDELRGEVRLDQLAMTISGVHLKSEGGLHASLENAGVHLDPLHITGEETDLHAQGTMGLKAPQPLDFAASGAINFKLGQMLDPDLTAGGTATFQVEGHGPLRNPGLRGNIQFHNGSLALEDLPNGLSQLEGTLEFNQDRLEVKSLTAVSGGGQLAVTGYLAYQRGLYADLRVTAKGIRIRYPAGVSSLADATLHLQGLENNLLLGGNVLITRFSVSPDMDFAALATQAALSPTVVPPNAPSSHVRLDVHVTSSPQLNFQNTVAKLAGDVDLRLRGTIAAPTLLGSVQITEGNALIAGTRYELQRGAVSFSNPVRIEPSIDLSATAHVSDYDITLGLHGTPEKMSVTYRSDPPLPEADVVALLALGRTQSQSRLYTQQQEQQVSNPTTDALLGGALNASVSSRVQRLFGGGAVKVDPNYIGALGNSTSRIIVEEQVGRDVTLTYATNVDTTQQQLLQAEIAINRHVSLLIARDESGVFSMVIKATRRYR